MRIESERNSVITGLRELKTPRLTTLRN